MAGIDVFVDAHQVQDMSSAASASTTQTLLKTLIANAILTAASTGLKTSTTSMSGKTAVDVLYVLSTLNSLGYSATLSGSTPNLVITWN